MLCSSQAVKEGELLAHVPLTLALTDHPDDRDSNQALGKDSLPDMRLARKLLLERKLGPSSKWYNYLQVMPHHQCGDLRQSP